MNQKNYITPQGFQKLKDEYAELAHGERPKLVEVVAWAASNGDLSENADYQYGKKRLREIDKRLQYLTLRMEKAEIVDPSKISTERVVFGARVRIADEDENEKSFQIVGEDEIDLTRGFISWQSPVAKALLGRRVDDEVVIKKPAKDEFVRIVAIERGS